MAAAIPFGRGVLFSAPSPLPRIQCFEPLQLAPADPKLSFSSATATAATMTSSTVAFRAEAPVGAVECYARGCRPVYDEDEVCHASYGDSSDDDDDDEDGSSGAKSEMAWEEHRIRGGGPVGCRMERLLNGGGAWADGERAERYYESALHIEPRNSLLLLEYALFAWNALGDARRADGLFQRALLLAPSNPSFLASYASFLWQSEA